MSFTFTLRNNTKIELYSNTSFYNPHQQACMQIAQYLNIPFNQTYNNSLIPDDKVAAMSKKITKILLPILFALIILLVTVVGGALLFVYIRDGTL